LKITDDTLIEYTNTEWIYYDINVHFYTHAGTKGFKVYSGYIDTLVFSFRNDIMSIKESDGDFYNYIRYSGQIPPTEWVTKNEEPNNTKDQAFPLSFSEQQYSDLALNDTADWFSCTLEKNRLYVLKIHAMTVGNDLFAELYHEDSLIYITNSLNNFTKYRPEDYNEEEFKWTCPADGKYYFRFYSTCDWLEYGAFSGAKTTYRIQIDTADGYDQGALDRLEQLEALIENWYDENH
jgi:hypothetical protein